MSADTLRAAEEVAADYRIATPRAPKYGPPGKPAGNREYHRHLRFCRYHGGYFTWEEYVKAMEKRSKYGPPGAKDHWPEVQRHRRYVSRNGWCSWDEYLERSSISKRERREIENNVEKTIAKFRMLGLLK